VRHADYRFRSRVRAWRWRRAASLDKEVAIKFWKSSGSRSGCGGLFEGLLPLWNSGRPTHAIAENYLHHACKGDEPVIANLLQAGLQFSFSSSDSCQWVIREYCKNLEWGGEQQFAPSECSCIFGIIVDTYSVFKLQPWICKSKYQTLFTTCI